MDATKSTIDILENTLRKQGLLLDILLLRYPSKKILKLLRKKQTQELTSTEKGNITRHNIIWATDAYEVDKFQKEEGSTEFSAKKYMKPELVTSPYGLLIQPRASKSREEQLYRTKDKAEVFTPLDIIKQMNTAVDSYRVTKHTWQEYVKELKLEITCGEAPYIVSRYDPTAEEGHLIPLKKRVGFLDMKLRAVSKYAQDEAEWLYWAEQAFKASYGYEWQGDNLLLARENLLYSFIDYYEDKFGKKPSLELQEKFAVIISWNIFQMDGLKYVIPMSCNHKDVKVPAENRIDEYIPEKVEKYECAGCKYRQPLKHNGKYVKIMDWEKNKVVRFVDLLGE